MRGKKRIIFGFVLLLAINLCSCGNDGDKQQLVGGFNITEKSEDNKESLQEDSFTKEVPSNAANGVRGNDLESVSDIQKDTDNSQQENTAVSELTEKTEVNGGDDLEINPKSAILMAGSMGDLGIGTLAYTVPDRDDEDYRLYFFQSGNEEDRNLSEASFIFPDVREGNVPIGKFKEIYYIDYTDISKDGSADIIVVSIYEKDGLEYYDTRVYEEGEYGFVVNIALTQGLNEKYYNVEDYPVWDIVTLPGE